MLTADDRCEISETLARHGHLFDEGHLDRLDSLFTPDVIYDVSEIGGTVLVGIDEVRAAALELGARNPVAHMITNVVITDDPVHALAAPSDTVHVVAKAFSVTRDGRCLTATYEDTMRRTPDGWRLSHRVIRPRREPLGGLAGVEGG